MDWLLGRKSQSQNSPSQQPPPSAPSQAPSIQLQNPQLFETPDIDALLTPHNPASLHPLENLDKQTLDYIILEDEQIKSAGALPSRGWTDDLCYGTGTTYLTGILQRPISVML
jgi:mitochondrial import inner membrane translocase subunit TIM23